MESNEFIFLKQLINDGKAKFSFNKFFVRKTLSLFLIYKNNQTLLWAYNFFVFLASEWFCISLSIFLAWRFHTWWFIIIGISFSWIIDSIVKGMTIHFLPQSLLRDENLLNYLWEQNPFHISIVSTKMITQKENIERMMQALSKSPEYIDSPGGKRYTMTQKIGEEKSKDTQKAKYLKEKIVSIIIVPPHPWQEVVNEFREY